MVFCQHAIDCMSAIAMTVIVEVCYASYRAAIISVPSESDPLTSYTIEIGSADLRVTCSCKAFEFRGRTCKHLRQFEIVERPCGWRSNRSAIAYAKDGLCPLCGSAIVKEVR